MKKPWSPLITVTLVFALFGCGGGGSSNVMQPTGTSQMSSVFLVGEDAPAPLPSVLAFNVMITGLSLNSSTGSAQALTGPVTVDFVRLLGLRTLIGFNSIPVGTYTSATVMLQSPVISFLDLTTAPPSVGTLDGTLTNSTVTVALAHPLEVTANGLAGLHMEFDLRQSLQVDGSGNLTGVVNPNIDLRPVNAGDDDAEIDELRGGLVSVNLSGNSFVIQRPGGHQVTIDVDSNTRFNGNNSLGSLVPPAVIEVDGRVQNDGSILARFVEVVSTERAFIMGHIINVSPSSGPAATITLLVGEELPDLSGIPVGFPVTLDVSSVTRYGIRDIDNPFTNFIFNNSEMVLGQRVAVGGDLNTSTNPATFVPQRIVLRRQGVEGMLVQGSVNIISGNLGDFQLQNNGLLGLVLGTPLQVNTSDGTNFVNINGLAGLQGAGAARVRTAGLVLKNNVSNAPEMFAWNVQVLP